MNNTIFPFHDRHIGPSIQGSRAMLAALGIPSLETLISQAVPKSIRLERPLNIPEAVNEAEALSELAAKMGQNKTHKSFIGQGYHGTHVPAVIQRNLFENPAWYTAYTPYQSEISQGRLELLFHFQTLVTELTGLPVASASLLDEATAVAEAVGIAYRHHREKRNAHRACWRRASADSRCGQDPCRTARHEREWRRDRCAALRRSSCRGRTPMASMAITPPIIKAAKAAGALVIAVADPLALTINASPASLGADIAAGSMQRFGVPIGYGGPHAAYLAVSDTLTRLIPGRLVGQSVDSKGRAGYRLALQTREQHIRRDKATSNICTAQALLANMAVSFAIWHGPQGLRAIAARVHSQAARLAAGLKLLVCRLGGDALLRYDNGQCSRQGGFHCCRCRKGRAPAPHRRSGPSRHYG